MSTHTYTPPAIDADGNLLSTGPVSAPDPIRALVYAYASARAYDIVMGDDPAPCDPLTLETVIRWNPTLGGTLLMLDPRYTPRQVGDLDPDRALHAWIGAVCDARGDAYKVPDAYGAVRADVRRGRSKKGSTTKVVRHGVPVVQGSIDGAASLIPMVVRRRNGGWHGGDLMRAANLLYPELPRMRGSSDTYQGPVIIDADRSDQAARSALGVVGGDDKVRKPRGSRIRLPYVARKSDPRPTATALASARTDDTMFIGHEMVARGERAKARGKRDARTVDALTFRTLDALLAAVAVVDIAPGARILMRTDRLSLALCRGANGRYTGTVKRDDASVRIPAARTLTAVARRVALAAA